MSLCLSWDNHRLRQLEKDIVSLESSLNKSTSQADFNEAKRIITTFNTTLTNDLNNTQKRKFLRDDVPVAQRTGPNILLSKPRPSAKTRRSRRFKRKKPTSQDESFNDTATCPVLNASTIPLTDVEMSLLSKGLNFCPTPHEVDDKKVREDTRAFFRRLRLKEHFSRKDSNKDIADDPPPPLHNLEEHKLYRPKSTWEPAPGKCGALESYIDAVESDIEKLLANQQVVPDNLTKEERSTLQRLKNRDDIVIKKQTKDPQWLS